VTHSTAIRCDRDLGTREGGLSAALPALGRDVKGNRCCPSASSRGRGEGFRPSEPGKPRFALTTEPSLSADHAKSAFHAPGCDTPLARGAQARGLE